MSWLSRLCQCTSRPRSGSHRQVVDDGTSKQLAKATQSGDTDCDDGTLCFATLISCSGCSTLNDRTTSHFKIVFHNLPAVTEENHKGFQLVCTRIKSWTLCVPLPLSFFVTFFSFFPLISSLYFFIHLLFIPLLFAFFSVRRSLLFFIYFLHSILNSSFLFCPLCFLLTFSFVSVLHP